MQTYVFHVSIPGTGRVWRKLELRADQTLEDLHLAIQAAFEFANDHLYSFFMSGQAWDRRTEYSLPETDMPPFMQPPSPEAMTQIIMEQLQQILLVPGRGIPERIERETGIEPDKLQAALRMLVEEANRLVNDMNAEMESRNVQTTRLSDLNLRLKQEFMYLFDYGDEWRFKVRVHAINETDAAQTYPRVVETVGKPPEQYAYPDEDFDEDGDDFGGFWIIPPPGRG